MAEFNHAAFEAGLAALRDQFLRDLPARIAQILACLEADGALQADSSVAHLHRLAGAAGSLGFLHLANAARTFEATLNSPSAACDIQLRSQQLQEAALMALQAQHSPNDSHSHTPK